MWYSIQNSPDSILLACIYSPRRLIYSHSKNTSLRSIELSIPPYKLMPDMLYRPEHHKHEEDGFGHPNAQERDHSNTILLLFCNVATIFVYFHNSPEERFCRFSPAKYFRIGVADIPATSMFLRSLVKGATWLLPITSSGAPKLLYELAGFDQAACLDEASRLIAQKTTFLNRHEIPESLFLVLSRRKTLSVSLSIS